MLTNRLRPANNISYFARLLHNPFEVRQQVAEEDHDSAVDAEGIGSQRGREEGTSYVHTASVCTKCIDEVHTCTTDAACGYGSDPSPDDAACEARRERSATLRASIPPALGLRRKRRGCSKKRGVQRAEVEGIRVCGPGSTPTRSSDNDDDGRDTRGATVADDMEVMYAS